MSLRRPDRVNVLAARQSEGRSAYTLYVIMVQWAHSQEWSIERRFSEFEELRTRLNELVPNELPPLPAKTLTRIMDASFVAQRKQDLDRWIQHIQQCEFIRRCSIYQSFLGVDNHVTPSIANAHLPVERQAVVDPQFGLNHAVYHPAEQLMFTACEDVHLLSKLERKLTNMRMPWEKQGGLAPLGCFATWRIGDSPRASCVIYYPVAAVCVCVIPSQRAAYVGLDNGRVHAYVADPTWTSFAPIGEHAVHNGRVTAIAYASRKSAVLSVGLDNHMCVIDAADRRALHSIAVGGGLHVGSLSLSAIRTDDDYERAFVASSTGTIFIYSTAMLPTQAPVLIHQLQGHSAPVKCLSYNRADGLLFSGSDDFNIGVWTIAPGGSPNEVSRSRLQGMMTNGIPKAVTAICYAAPLQQVITGYNDGYIAVWNVQTGRLSYGWKGHEHTVTQMLFDPQQRTLISAGHDGKVKLWQLKDEQTIAKILDKLGSRKTSSVESEQGSAAAAYLAAASNESESANEPLQPPIADQTITTTASQETNEDIHSNNQALKSSPENEQKHDYVPEANSSFASDPLSVAQSTNEQVVQSVIASFQELSVEPLESGGDELVSPSKSHAVEDLVQQTATNEVDLF